MHAWSEVNHDLGYKPIPGPASHDELRILDRINGIVLRGELLLQQLQAAAESRISSADRKFTNQYELGAFLQNYVSRNSPTTALMGRLDIVFEVLKAMDLDSPKAIDAELEKWDKKEAAHSSVALSFMDHIFSTSHGIKLLGDAEDRETSTPQSPPFASSSDEVHRYRSRRQILFNAAIVYDGLSRKGPKRRSIRSLSDFNLRTVRFHQLYSSIEHENSISNPGNWQVVDELWLWFKENTDIKARVALGIAVLEKPHITDRLKSSSETEVEDEDEEEIKAEEERTDFLSAFDRVQRREWNSSRQGWRRKISST